jgi:hypothetical protein
MSRVTHQTVRLSRGKHTSPSDGACVMELASMLAGEPFSDHPRSVCPVIGSLLRAYNDSVDSARRQDLYACASKIIGSAAGDDVQRARAQHLRRWAEERRPRHWTLWLGSGLHSLLGGRRESVELAGPRALRAVPRTEEAHAAVLAVVDELLEIGRVPQPTLAAYADSDTGSPCHATNARHVAAIHEG